jgi:putative endonuclease
MRHGLDAPRPSSKNMAESYSYFVYIVASRSRNLCTGVTNDLERRILQHKRGLVSGFTKRYRIQRLVYYEMFGDIKAAIAREKQVKRWNREKRLALIASQNPTWKDLTEFLFPKLDSTE